MLTVTTGSQIGSVSLRLLSVEKAKAPYQGVDPLTPEDVADCLMFALTRPLHVNVDEIVVKALAQTSGGRIHRTE